MQPTLLDLTPSSPINRTICIDIPPSTQIPSIHKPKKKLHHNGSKYTGNQNAHHDQVTLSVLQPSRSLVVTLPARVQRIRRQDTAQIPPPRDNRRRSGDADLAVSWLEDLGGPGHGDGHGRTQAESDD